MSKKKVEITGRCFCGEIQYTIESKILKSGICHCDGCQRLTGGGPRPFIVVSAKSFSVKGEPKQFSRLGESGKDVHYNFCGTCGSMVFGRLDVWPSVVSVSASTLDDKTIFSPEMYLWTDEAPKWTMFDANIPQFPRNP